MSIDYLFISYIKVYCNKEIVTRMYERNGGGISKFLRTNRIQISRLYGQNAYYCVCMSVPNKQKALI